MSHYKPLAGWRVSRFVFDVLLLMLACSCAAHADTWSPGQVIVYNQNDWAAGGSASVLLDNEFPTVYENSGGAVLVGSPTGFEMLFDSVLAIQNYLVQGGLPSSLTASLVDPTESPSGAFGGDCARSGVGC